MLAGCLPVGGPPAGQHLVHDRTLTSAFFAPSESEAVPSSLFFAGPSRPVVDSSSGSSWGGEVIELYVHPHGDAASPTSELSSLRPAVENAAPTQLGVAGTAPASDILGRLFLTTFQAPAAPAPGSGPYVGVTPSQYGIRRYDPRTGTLGPVMASALQFSGSRARVFAGDARNGVLLDLQGSRELADVHGAVFVGEDFYCVAATRAQPLGSPSSSALTRIKPNAEPEVLLSSSGWLSITALPGAPPDRLLVRQSTATPTLPGIFMLDLETLAITALPLEPGNTSFMSASPSGRWLLFSKMTVPSGAGEPPVQTLILVDWTTGARMEVIPSDATEPGAWHSPEWRPGHDELWIQTSNGMLRVVEPGDLLTAVPTAPGLVSAAVQSTGTNDVSIFTRDGQHRFLRGPDPGAVYLVSVDDPTLPPLQINPAGTHLGRLWDIGDGRLLVGAVAEDAGRQELFLVDPAAGTSRTLAGGGQLVAVGKTRALALLAWDGGRNSGALTLIDLATGAQTVLAEDVYLAAVDPGHFADVPPDTDVLAAGTEIAFLSRSRFASPYDGLWGTRLP